MKIIYGVFYVDARTYLLRSIYISGTSTLSRSYKSTQDNPDRVHTQSLNSTRTRIYACAYYCTRRHPAHPTVTVTVPAVILHPRERCSYKLCDILVVYTHGTSYHIVPGAGFLRAYSYTLDTGTLSIRYSSRRTTTYHIPYQVFGSPIIFLICCAEKKNRRCFRYETRSWLQRRELSP